MMKKIIIFVLFVKIVKHYLNIENSYLMGVQAIYIDYNMAISYRSWYHPKTSISAQVDSRGLIWVEWWYQDLYGKGYVIICLSHI